VKPSTVLVAATACGLLGCTPGQIDPGAADAGAGEPDAAPIAGEPDGAPIVGEPDAATPQPDAAVERPCPDGAVCFSMPGLVHAPTVGDEVRRVSLHPPAGDYGAIHVELDVYHGGWAPDPEAVRHNIFWLAHDKRNRDMYGYVNFVKPHTVLLRHGIDQAQGDKAKLTDNAPLPADRVYSFAYDYDVAAAEILLRVTSGGELVSEIADAPNTDTIHFGSSQTLDFDLGFPGDENVQEPATYGWEYRDLWVVLSR